MARALKDTARCDGVAKRASPGIRRQMAPCASTWTRRSRTIRYRRRLEGKCPSDPAETDCFDVRKVKQPMATLKFLKRLTHHRPRVPRRTGQQCLDDLGWSENRGVYDDLCYLRQAHLFRALWPRRHRHGYCTKDDDRLFRATSCAQSTMPNANDPSTAPCHAVDASSGQKFVLQYPPGTGLALALFPEGFQVISLHVTANVIVLASALVALMRASTATLRHAWPRFSALPRFI